MKKFKWKWLVCYIILIWNTLFVIKNVAINTKSIGILREAVINCSKKVNIHSHYKNQTGNVLLPFTSHNINFLPGSQSLMSQANTHLRLSFFIVPQVNREKYMECDSYSHVCLCTKPRCTKLGCSRWPDRIFRSTY